MAAQIPTDTENRLLLFLIGMADSKEGVIAKGNFPIRFSRGFLKNKKGALNILL